MWPLVMYSNNAYRDMKGTEGNIQPGACWQLNDFVHYMTWQNTFSVQLFLYHGGWVNQMLLPVLQIISYMS